MPRRGGAPPGPFCGREDPRCGCACAQMASVFRASGGPAGRAALEYYQQGFDTGPDWAEVVLPLSGFAASGRMMAGAVRPEDVRAVGLVAYGRDHAADVSLAAMGAL